MTIGRLFRVASLGSWILGSLAALIATPGFAAAPVDFNREIRPILSANCFACHGPDAAERKGDLRLDTREGLSGDRGGYAAITPGKPEASAVVERLTTSDPNLLMPP